MLRRLLKIVKEQTGITKEDQIVVRIEHAKKQKLKQEAEIEGVSLTSYILSLIESGREQRVRRLIREVELS